LCNCRERVPIGTERRSYERHPRHVRATHAWPRRIPSNKKCRTHSRPHATTRQVAGPPHAQSAPSPTAPRPPQACASPFESAALVANSHRVRREPQRSQDRMVGTFTPRFSDLPGAVLLCLWQALPASDQLYTFPQVRARTPACSTAAPCQRRSHGRTIVTATK
jgi:hypothetical protein